MEAAAWWYLAAKAVHVAAVLAWLGGMLLVAVLLAALRTLPAVHLPPDRGLLVAVRRWDSRVTTPAMLLAWVLGLFLVWRGGWMGAGWLSAKLGLVMALSALHGMLTGSLRRAVEGGGPPGAAWARRAAPAILVAAVVIVLLVVGKPG